MNVAVAQKPIESIATERRTIRRFELPDLSFHGAWVMQRLLKAFPHLSPPALGGWLRGLIEDRENCFLFQDHSVGLAVVERSHTLSPRALVRERFVWAQDPENKQHVEEAAAFYPEFARWAKHLDADTMIVQVASDVTHERIKELLGRVFTRQEMFAKL